MFASLSLSEPIAPRGPVPSYLRSKSQISARFGRVRGLTRVNDVYEAGCCRLKFPRSQRDCHGVIVNTAGGMTGGDEASMVLHPGRRRPRRADDAVGREDLSLRPRSGASVDLDQAGQACGAGLAAARGDLVQRRKLLAAPGRRHGSRGAAHGAGDIDLWTIGQRRARKSRKHFRTVGSFAGRGASHSPKASNSTGILLGSSIFPRSEAARVRWQPFCMLRRTPSGVLRLPANPGAGNQRMRGECVGRNVACALRVA